MQHLTNFGFAVTLGTILFLCQCNEIMEDKNVASLKVINLLKEHMDQDDHGIMQIL